MKPYHLGGRGGGRASVKSKFTQKLRLLIWEYYANSSVIGACQLIYMITLADEPPPDAVIRS